MMASYKDDSSSQVDKENLVARPKAFLPKQNTVCSIENSKTKKFIRKKPAPDSKPYLNSQLIAYSLSSKIMQEPKYMNILSQQTVPTSISLPYRDSIQLEEKKAQSVESIASEPYIGVSDVNANLKPKIVCPLALEV